MSNPAAEVKSRPMGRRCLRGIPLPKLMLTFCVLAGVTDRGALAQVFDVEIQPEADAQVQWHEILDWANTNYGSELELQVGAENTPLPDKRYRSYLRFDLSALPAAFTLERARLRLFTEIYTPLPATVVELYRVADDGWSESGITWNNQPGPSGGVWATTTVAALQETYWDFTPAWSPAADVADGALSLFLRIQDESLEGFEIRGIFNSREVAAGVAFSRPTLELRYRIGEPPPLPVTEAGYRFAKVATLDAGPQLWGLTGDDQGRVYAGHNSNFTGPAPVRRFDPALYAGTPLVFDDAQQRFGPDVGDADGIAYGAGKIFVADNLGGIRQIPVATPSSPSYFAVFVALNGGGSPLVHRPADGHLFVSFGEVAPLLQEFNAGGTLVAQSFLGATAETMTLDPATGSIYYSPNGTSVRRFDPSGPSDEAIGTASGTINGGLFFDPLSGLLFVGTANGAQPGCIETMDPSTGATQRFATGFDPENVPGGVLGIWRDPTSGDLYALQSDALFRLPSAKVFPSDAVPACGSWGRSLLAIALVIAAGLASCRSRGASVPWAR
ncbi:MAG: DNRLRE domain-containing protein [Myxococcota bacterium]